MKTKKTVVLLAKPNIGVEDLVVNNVREYRVGYKLIWIEYGNYSIMAVKRSDYESMRVTEEADIIIDSADPNFERINCLRDMS